MRLAPRVYKGIQTKLYKYWADVETYVIKDVNSAISVYEELVKNKLGRSECYIDYAHSLVVLGSVSGAIDVLKEAMNKCDDTYMIKEKLKGMIELFGGGEEEELPKE